MVFLALYELIKVAIEGRTTYITQNALSRYGDIDKAKIKRKYK